MNKTQDFFPSDDTPRHLPTPEEIIRQYPVFGLQVAAEIIYLARCREGDGKAATVNYIHHVASQVPSDEAWYDRLQWYWSINALGYANSKQEFFTKELVKLASRVLELERQVETLTWQQSGGQGG